MGKPDDLVVAMVRLSRPAHRALANAGITTFAQLATWTREEVAALHGIGPKAFPELIDALAKRGLDFRQP